jgi:hypothetical protein
MYGLNAGRSSVEMTIEELISENSLFEQRADDFAKLKIGSHWNIDLIQYLDLPRDLIERLNTLARGYNSDESTAATNVLNELRNKQS